MGAGATGSGWRGGRGGGGDRNPQCDPCLIKTQRSGTKIFWTCITNIAE